MSSPSALFTSYFIVAILGERILADNADQEQQTNNSTSNSTTPSSLDSIITDDVYVSNTTVDENADYLYILDRQQLLIGVIAPRISGIIILISSFFMLYMSWKRRCKLFHRLVLGMSFYLFLTGICILVGTAAIPSTDDNAIGNIGTITTCTIQGFLVQLGSMISILYYCCFSLYSYVGVINNFQDSKIKWIEKYIHVGVHIYPIFSAIYLTYKEAFNNTGIGYCHIQSSALGCAGRFEPKSTEDDVDDIDDIKCDRGPEGYEYIVLILWSLPLFLCLFCTTSTMILLYCKVKQKQDQIYINASTVAYQSIIYLSALYATLLPLLSTELVFMFRGPGGYSNKTEVLFALMVFEYLVFSLFSLWSMLCYRYFSIESSIEIKQQQLSIEQQNNPPSNSTVTTTDQQQNQTNTSSAEEERTKNTSSSAEYIFSSHELPPNTTATTISNRDSSFKPTIELRNKGERSSKKDISSPRQTYSFNIFDGTNASGAFAAFIHDGDSDDENIDNEQTKHWADVQNHV